MEKQKYETIVQEQLDQAKQRIEGALNPIGGLSQQQVKDIIGTYRVAVEPNFIPWMVQAYQTAQSDVARKVILENIQDEISQDHPQMLRDFCFDAGVILSLEHYTRASQPVIDMWTLFSQKNGLTNTTIAATLENTSPVFIPYLAELSKSLGGRNLAYTDVHGEADVEHARELYSGLIEEMDKANGPWRTVATAVEKTTGFLEKILSP